MTTEQQPTPAPLKIAILDRGWVFVGRVTETPGSVSLNNAACVRRWGTTRGIGQLATEGPTKTTVLDQAGTVTVPRSSIIAILDTGESSWPGR